MKFLTPLTTSTTSESNLRRLVAKVRQFEHDLESLPDSQFRNAAASLRDETVEDNLASLNPATICRRTATGAQAVQRIFGFRLHDVQLMAIIAGANGQAVEMQTGEGKTLVSGVTAYVRSLDRKGVHVATTNDYLAARDHEELTEIYQLLGITSAILPDERNLNRCRAAYDADVTYGPGYQFGFDYLHDQLALRENRPTGLGQSVLQEINGLDWRHLLGQTRPHDFTVVDEADSVLIDEATTPLVIAAGPIEEKSFEPYLQANSLVRSLKEDTDYTRSGGGQRIELTPATRLQILNDLKRQHKKLKLVRPWTDYVENALKAHHCFHNGEHYVVVDGKVQIVDQLTGRIHPDRSWQAGLHQAIEAKEDVEVELRPSSIGRMTRQRYFGKYQQMCGLSGTISGVADEVRRVYRMKTVKIPTNRPCRRKILRSRFFCSWEAKLVAIAADCQKRHATGQPILIGTRTIAQSLRVEDVLQRHGLSTVVLNGVQDCDEAAIVAQAGQPGTITIATNMAGRGTDIKLTDESRGVGGLHVIGTEPNSSARVDRQLVGRSARQGDPGSAQFFLSAEDDLLVQHSEQDSSTRRLVRRMASGADNTGECRHDFSANIAAVQTAEEDRVRGARENLTSTDRWFDLIRDTVSRER